VLTTEARARHAAYMRDFYRRRRAELNAMPKIPCACGCGTLIPPLTRKLTAAKYAPSHHPAGRIRKGDTREAGRAWKGGRSRFSATGYVVVLVSPDHPMANKNGYVLEHRLVMAKAIGRHLGPQEVVHHVNGDPSDNRLENLMLFANHSAHMKHHARLRKGGA
jgi:hypothetical protein